MIHQSSLRWVLRGIVSIGLLAVLIWKIDMRSVAQSFQLVSPFVLGLASLTVALNRLMVCARLRLLLTAKGIGISFLSMAKLNWKCDFAGSFLPGTVGGDALRMIGLSRGHTQGRHAVTAVAMDRILGMASFLVLAVTGSAYGVSQGFVHQNIFWVAAILTGLAAAAFFVFLRLRRRFEPLVDKGQNVFLNKIRSVIDSFLDYNDSRSILLQGFFLSLCIQGLRVLTAYCLSTGMGLGVPFSYFLICVPLAFFATLIPVSIGGWGVQEGAYIACLDLIGVAAADAFTLSVISSLITIAVAFPGLIFFMKEGFVKKQNRLDGVTQ